MKALLMWLMVAAILAVAGCVRSLNPLVTPEDMVFDPALVGVWQGEDGKETWAFSSAEDTHYDLVYTDEEGHAARFTAALMKLGDVRYLNFTPNDTPENPNGFYQWHVLLTHSFVKVRQIEPTLQMQFPDTDWLKELLEKDPSALQHAHIDQELILTAPTPALQVFWREHAGTAGAFEEASDLKKQPAAD